MYTYTTPGVYFERADEEPQAIGPLRTDIAGFVGIAARGPLHHAVRVSSWQQFVSTFGAHIPQGFLAYAVQGFFENGGQLCWVVRVADPDTALYGGERLLDDDGHPTLRLRASSQGSWSQQLGVSVMRTAADRFTLGLRLPPDQQETWPNLTMQAGQPRYAPDILNDQQTGSRLVCAEDLKPATPAPANTPRRPEHGWLQGGRDGLAGLTTAHFVGDGGNPWGLAALEPVEDIAIVAVPDALPAPAPPAPQPPPPPKLDCSRIPGRVTIAALAADGAQDRQQEEWPPPPDSASIQEAIVAHCERLRYRFGVLDIPDGLQRIENVLAWRAPFTSAYAALYHPWLGMPDPLSPDGSLRFVPPSGHVAGIYALTDLQVGVHKPPANEPVAAANDVRFRLSDSAHGELNTGGVNVIRAYPGRGLRAAGARTLSEDSQWLYVNVRRLVSMIEATLDRDTQWMVFEPNSRETWREMDRVVRSFLDQLWRRGMLDGTRAEDAYSVQCDEATNPPQDTEDGRLTCLLGVLPPWPAEFVVVRIGQTQNEVEMVGQGAGSNG
jgi:uncharacterized protein